VLFSALARAKGLYDPSNESDSCGVAMITDIGKRLLPLSVQPDHYVQGHADDDAAAAIFFGCA
jgi:hypothetical protein